MNRFDFDKSTYRYFWKCPGVFVLAVTLSVALSACALFPETGKKTKLPFPENDMQEMLGIVDDLFDPDGTVHHYTSELGNVGQEVLVPEILPKANIGIYVWLGESRYFVKSNVRAVRIPEEGRLIAQLSSVPSAVELSGLAAVDGLELSETQQLDKLLLSVEKLKLKTLILKDVSLGEAGVEAINRMPYLREAYFYGVRSPSLAKCGNAGLVKLNIKAVVPESVLVPMLGQCRQVRRLSVQDVLLNDETIAAITKMTDLETLYLNHTNLNDRWLAALLPNPRWHLTCLEIHQTNITDAGLGCVYRQPGMTHLNFSRCSVSDAGLRPVSTLTELEILDLGNTSVTDKTVSRLAGLKQLRRLNIGNTKITPACFDDLSKMKSLKVLTLGRQGFSLNLLLKLKKALPDCIIQAN